MQHDFDDGPGTRFHFMLPKHPSTRKTLRREPSYLGVSRRLPPRQVDYSAYGGTGERSTRMNWSGSTLPRARTKCRIRWCVAVVCLFRLACALSATEPALVRLAVSGGEDIRFSHLTRKDGLSPGQVRDILQDDRGFLWFNTSGF